jgi:hypothetical protein
MTRAQKRHYKERMSEDFAWKILRQRFRDSIIKAMINGRIKVVKPPARAK